MANAIYPKAREKWALGEIDWVDDDIIVILLDLQGGTGYTYDDSHEFLSDVPADARVATASLTGKTAVNGVLDADDVTFPTVTGNQSEALVVVKDTGSDATSPLLIYIDTADSGLPVTPNGGDIDVKWHANGIAVL